MPEARAKRRRLFAIIALEILITAFHYFSLLGMQFHAELFTALYLIPIVLAALYFGLSGGLILSLTTSVLYLPYLLLIAETAQVRLDHYIAILELNILAYVVGSITEQRSRAENRALGTAALERELEVARKVQQSLLPRRIEIISGYDVGAYIAYARTVGGDYYDVFPLEGDAVALSIADVSGKGMPAALLVSLAKYSIRAEAASGEPPEEIFRSVNDIIRSATSSSMFISAIYAEVHPHDGKIRYINSGHDTPLFWHARTRQISRLPSTGGIVLGVMRDIRPVLQEAVLERDDIILFFTDGVIEARSPEGEMFGSKRLYESLKINAHLSAQMIVENLRDIILQFSGHILYDDMTLLVLKRLGDGQEME